MTHIVIYILSASTLLIQSFVAYTGETSQTAKAAGSKDSAVKFTYNRLIHESSPYLLQHAANPVNWFPWGEEAFGKAKREDKLILLSIGYSTCHWCHVMEHESFSDGDVAELLNKNFVSIKVDREERPDIDKVYMTITQMMTGRGGWPMTVILTPEKKPFFTGTYFPKKARWGQPGLMELLPALQDAWLSNRGKILEDADKITQVLRQANKQKPGDSLDKTVLDKTQKLLKERFDITEGGFGSKPKFPMPHYLSFLLRYYYRTGNKQDLYMVEKTLSQMRPGGIYDHVGFGFHRYATDSRWLVPHFEKMLYDQALLAIAYSEAYQVTGKVLFKQTAAEIISYVMRDMASPEGGFYSAEDADSEGVEGKFYLWTLEEIREIIGKEEADLYKTIYNVKIGGNFREEATGHAVQSNILNMPKPLHQIAEDMNIPEAQLHERLEKSRRKLFNAREKRVHPFKDDKILTDWNGLMIAALAKTGQALDEPKYIDAAERAGNFVISDLIDSNGRLLKRYRKGTAGVAAYLNDYAFMVWGLLELYEATFNTKYLKEAIRLNDIMLSRFWDEQDGGFYMTADDSEKVIVRMKEIDDGAIPSGNSVAAMNLLRLSRITGRNVYASHTEKITTAFSNSLNSYPATSTHLMSALEFALNPTYEVVIVGKPRASDTRSMLAALRKAFIPAKVVLFRSPDTEDAEILTIAPYTAAMTALNGNATAYVCENFSCKLPTTSIREMLESLQVNPSADKGLGLRPLGR